MKLPPYPNNIGKRRKFIDINDQPFYTKIVDEVVVKQGKSKLIYLQKLVHEKKGNIEYRLGYYMIGVQPRMKGKWVWGQFCTILPKQEFRKIIKLAKNKGWI